MPVTTFDVFPLRCSCCGAQLEPRPVLCPVCGCALVARYEQDARGPVPVTLWCERCQEVRG